MKVPMFLVYGVPRSGTTRLCFELDARVPEGFRVLNEPFHASPATRAAYGSTCPHTEPEPAKEWLLSRSDIAGIKLVSNRTDSIFAERYHRLFGMIMCLHRNPIDIAISLEAANQSENWNRGDGISGDYCPPKVHVCEATLAMVAEFRVNLFRFRDLRIRSGLGGLIDVTYDGQSEVGTAARCLGLPEKRLRPPYRDIRKMGPCDAHAERCSNLDAVVRFFRQ